MGFDDRFKRIFEKREKYDPLGHGLLKFQMKKDSKMIKGMAYGTANALGGDGDNWLASRFYDLGDEASKNEQDPVRGIGRAAATAGVVVGGMYAAGALGAGAGGAAAGAGAGAGAAAGGSGLVASTGAGTSLVGAVGTGGGAAAAGGGLTLGGTGAAGAGMVSSGIGGGISGGVLTGAAAGSGSLVAANAGGGTGGAGGASWQKYAKMANGMGGGGGGGQQPARLDISKFMEPLDNEDDQVANISTDPETGETLVTYRSGRVARTSGRAQADFGLGDV